MKMKKIILAGTVALFAVMAVPAQAELAAQPWILTSTSLVKTGFLQYIKACHWKRSEYVNGIYQAEMTTTYTSKFSGCPAPMN